MRADDITLDDLFPKPTMQPHPGIATEAEAQPRSRASSEAELGPRPSSRAFFAIFDQLPQAVRLACHQHPTGPNARLLEQLYTLQHKRKQTRQTIPNMLRLVQQDGEAHVAAQIRRGNLTARAGLALEDLGL